MYSSTVFVLMVVVVLEVSPTCVYVAVVVTVRQALQLVMPAHTATLISATNTNNSFFIVLLVFG